MPYHLYHIMKGAALLIIACLLTSLLHAQDSPTTTITPTPSPSATRTVTRTPSPIRTATPTATDIPAPTSTATASPTATPSLNATLQAVLSDDPGSPLVGPLSGEIVYVPAAQRATIGRVAAGVFTDHFVAEARFFNPFDAVEGQWDYGFFFREGQRGWRYWLVIDSRGVWGLHVQVPDYRVIEVGFVPDLRTGAGQANTLRLAVSSTQGVLFVNDIQTAVLDLSLMEDYGEVFVLACAYQDSCAETTGDSAVRFADFSVWPIGPALRLTPFATNTIDPQIQTAEAAASAVIATATAASAATQATATAEAASTQAIAATEAALDLTATPVPVGDLRPGRDNIGELAPGGAQVWTLKVDELAIISVSILVDWHPRLALYAPDGQLQRVDDSYSRLLAIRPAVIAYGFRAGEYRVVVRGATGTEGGRYRLLVSQGSLLGTATPTPGR